MGLSCCRRGSDDPVNSESYHALEETEVASVSWRKRVGWALLTLSHVGILAFNATRQTHDSWGGYAFKLTQLSAAMTLAHDAVHDASVTKDWLVKLFACLPVGSGKWPNWAIKNDTYTHREGISNLAFTLELLVTVMYWSLMGLTDEKNSSVPEKVNAFLMHGGIFITLFVDYLVNELPYHFRHALANSATFLALYTGWNFAGQAATTVPVYPDMDWFNELPNILYAFLFGAGSALAITSLLKMLTRIRDRMPPVSMCCQPFFCNRATAGTIGEHAHQPT